MIWPYSISGRECLPKLASNTVHVCSVSTGKADKFENFAEVLSPKEIRRAKKFYFEPDRASAYAVGSIGCTEKVWR